eukprot:1151493-Pelagomonas_calceolata.AAC.13
MVSFLLAVKLAELYCPRGFPSLLVFCIECSVLAQASGVSWVAQRERMKDEGPQWDSLDAAAGLPHSTHLFYVPI